MQLRKASNRWRCLPTAELVQHRPQQSWFAIGSLSPWTLTGMCGAVLSVQNMPWYAMHAASVPQTHPGARSACLKSPVLELQVRAQDCTLLSSSYFCCRSCRFSKSSSCPRCWALSSCSLYLSSSLSLSLHRKFQRMGGRSIWLPSLLHLPVLEVQVMPRESAAPLQCHMSSSLVSFASTRLHVVSLINIMLR